MAIQHKPAQESLSLLISYSPAYWSAYEQMMQERKALETSNFNTSFWADVYNQRAVRDGNPLRACVICGRLHELPVCELGEISTPNVTKGYKNSEARDISLANVPKYGQQTKVPVSK